MEFNPIMERNRLLDELFGKVESLLEDNVFVVADIQRRQYLIDTAERMDKEAVSV